MGSPEINRIKGIVREFTEADNPIKTVFPKADPIIFVRLIFEEKAKKEKIYSYTLKLCLALNWLHDY